MQISKIDINRQNNGSNRLFGIAAPTIPNRRLLIEAAEDVLCIKQKYDKLMLKYRTGVNMLSTGEIRKLGEELAKTRDL